MASPARRARGFTRWLCTAGLMCLLGVYVGAVLAQTPSEATSPEKKVGAGTSQTTAGNAPAKVAVLILPESTDSARIALTYNRKVEHRRVQQEIADLARFAGGHLSGNVEIKDYSLNPGNLRRFPVTTSAEFTLVQSPLFQDAEPRLLPYLQAFRTWRSLDVLFQLPGATESAGPLRFQSEAISVWLYRDNGVYRYHAEIADGKAALPIPTFVQEPAAAPTANASSGGAGAERTTPSSPSSWPLMLIIAGGGLISGAGLYLLAARRSAGKVSPHPQ